MPTFVDLTNQVQKVLQIAHGGTGTVYGYGRERLVLPFMNDTGGSLAIGTLVKLHAASSDRRVEPTTVVNDRNAVGVVVGRFLTDAEPVGQYDAVAPGDKETVAVCVAGRCPVLVSAAVTIGQYAYCSATDGQALGSSVPVTGGFGIFGGSTTGAGSAEVILGGTAAAAGAFPEQFYDINFIISAGGAATPQLGSQAAVNISAPGTIVAARMLALSSGSAVVDIEKATYSGYPTTSSICGSFKPTLSGASKSEDTTLSGWTTALAMGDVLVFQLDSMSSIFVVTCSLKVRRT